MIIEQMHKARKKDYGHSSLSTVVLSPNARQTGTSNTSYLSPITNPSDHSSRMIADAFQINSGTVLRNLKMYKVLEKLEAIPIGATAGIETVTLTQKGIIFRYSDLEPYMMPLAQVSDGIYSAQCTLYPMLIEDGKALDDGEDVTTSKSYDNSTYPQSLAASFGNEHTLRLSDDGIFIADLGSDIETYMIDELGYFNLSIPSTTYSWFDLVNPTEKYVIFPKRSISTTLDPLDWIELKLDMGYIMLDAAVQDGIYSLANVIETNYR